MFIEKETGKLSKIRKPGMIFEGDEQPQCLPNHAGPMDLKNTLAFTKL
jgi:hypothetical protein